MRSVSSETGQAFKKVSGLLVTGAAGRIRPRVAMSSQPKLPVVKGLFVSLVLFAVGGLFAQPASAQSFDHPGGLHTKADLDRMKTKVAAGEHPWIDGWNALIRDGKAQADYRPGPHPHMASRQRAQRSGNRRGDSGSSIGT